MALGVHRGGGGLCGGEDATTSLVVIVMVLVAVLVAATYGRICYSMDIRNDARYLNKLRNCTIIVGNLQILLIEHVLNAEEFTRYRFPELVEITDYLLLFRVSKLITLRHLLPNLRVIRGQRLFMNHALIIFNMPHLQEIGLVNLVHVSRGAIQVDQCSQLCYVDTIDWKFMGAIQLDFFFKFPDCTPCAQRCNGYCWNENSCQKFTLEPCLATATIPVVTGNNTKANISKKVDVTSTESSLIPVGNSDVAKATLVVPAGSLARNSYCLVCRKYEDDGKCVEKCPPNKYTHERLSKCVTLHECHTMLRGIWWTLNDTCINQCPPRYKQVNASCEFCGSECVRYCQHTNETVYNLAKLQKFWGCTHIIGRFELKLVELYLADYLAMYLDQIVSIKGNVRIHRSKALTTLNFLKSLRYVEDGDLLIIDNPNLMQLWNFSDIDASGSNFTLTVTTGNVVIYNNPKLCYSEIVELARRSGMRYDTELARHGNGYKSLCYFIKADVRVLRTNSTYVELEWVRSGTNVTATDILGYSLYYLEVSGNRTVTMFDTRFQCGSISWQTVYVTSNPYVLKALKPFTRYAFYLQNMLGSFWQQTPIEYFNTRPDDPSEPVHFQTTPLNDSSIQLHWEPPYRPNGILSHYIITTYLQPDDFYTLELRDFCRYPQFYERERTRHRQQQQKPVVLPPSSPAPPLLPPKPTTPRTITYKNITFTIKAPKQCPCKPKETYYLEEDERRSDVFCDADVKPYCTNLLYNILGDESRHYYKRNSIKRMMSWGTADDNDSNVAVENNVTATVKEYFTSDATVTSYIVSNLRHYSLYMVLLSACNVNFTDRMPCSAVVMDTVRTYSRLASDAVRNVSIEVIEGRGHVLVRWWEPLDPNGGIVIAYQIQYKRTDLPRVQPNVDCISHREYLALNRTFNLTFLSVGEYFLRVRAVSLASHGNYSSKLYFVIDDDGEMLTRVRRRRLGYWWWLYAVASIVIIVSFAIALYFVYRWYVAKDERSQQQLLHLIASVNPDYAGIVYMEDEWELDRNDVQVLNELGKGSFGMVYRGMIRSRNCRCAIKTVNESAGVGDRVEFLNEGSVMKNFHDSHHVVQLLGIVSRGQPPYVVMELMEYGDLKRYLHRCREPSQHLTTVEMYRMAAEIADGMAYLAAKKYVHRDLAARNCMVHADRTVKIGDFGMARDIYETDYYRKETVGLLPVRWMSPESLGDGVFTSDSDCWSFGVVLWEIATFAEQPYQGMSNEEVFRYVQDGGKLTRPKECSDKFYDLMRVCWEWRPNSRPIFREIVGDLVDSVGEAFRLMSFCYSKKGQEFSLNAGPRPFNPPALRPKQRTIFDVREEEEVDEDGEIMVEFDDIVEDFDNPQPGPSRGRRPMKQRVKQRRKHQGSSFKDRQQQQQQSFPLLATVSREQKSGYYPVRIKASPGLPTIKSGSPQSYVLPQVADEESSASS